ncbi:MAG: malate dehydrogenase [Candidatus Bathyarchaeia archaeon]
MITIIGSGRVGSTIASLLVARELDDVTLIDIIQGLPQGEALDLGHMATRFESDVALRGSNDYKDMSGSDLVIVPAGLARKPGMTRLDLLQKNTEIVKTIAQKIAEFASKAKVMMVTNPLDAMTYVALKVTGFKSSSVFGMGGMLDVSRFESLLSEAIGVSRSSVEGLVIGEHGEAMLPLPRYSSVFGIPVTELLSPQQCAEAVEKTRKIAAEVIALKGATFYAPGLAVLKMAEAVVKDKKGVFPSSVYLDGQYGVKDLCIGVPIVLGRDGVERIIELNLTQEEKSKFMAGVESLRSALTSVNLAG